MGLTEMLPDKFWVVFGKTMKWSYWFVRRSAWVLGTSLALLALPPFLEQQRIEVQEMQTMQKKQVYTLEPSFPIKVDINIIFILFSIDASGTQSGYGWSIAGTKIVSLSVNQVL